MLNKKKSDQLISDSGVFQDSRTTQSQIFVALCHIISLALILLGFIAFIKGIN